tara:strand:+ start:5000 stop:5548 length:549 start_codon:yes stop_codon:yes gene_type:complete
MAGPGYTFIDEAEAASSSTSVLEITGIPDTYRHLELIFAGVGESISSYSFLTMRVNDVASAYYENGGVWSSGATTAGQGTGNNNGTYAYWGYVNGINSSPKQISHALMNIYGYNMSLQKTHTACSGASGTTSSVSNAYGVSNWGGVLPVTAAINKITVKLENGSYNFTEGSSIRLFGWGIPE